LVNIKLFLYEDALKLDTNTILILGKLLLTLE